MSLTRERMAQILDRNATKFAEHTEQLKTMAKYHEDRMAVLDKHAAVLDKHGLRVDAHQHILYRGFFGRLKWLMFGG